MFLNKVMHESIHMNSVALDYLLFLNAACLWYIYFLLT